MSSCRATSFYVAPGRKYSFAEATLATRENEAFIEFRHRKDVERYERDHPEWDRVCYVGPAGGVEALSASLVESPEKIERWKIDSRVVNGRAPSGAMHTLYNLCVGGVKKAGGAAAVASMFAGASKPLAQAVGEAAQRGDGFSLSVALGMREIVGDDKVAEIARGSAVWGHMGFGPVEPELVVSTYTLLEGHYGAVRAQKLLGQLVGDVPGRWRELVYRSAGTPNSALIALLDEGHNEESRLTSQRLWDGDGVLEKVSFNSSPVVRARSAVHPLASEDVVRRLSDDVDDFVRGAVASRRDVPEDLLVKLSGDPHSAVRRIVAQNVRTPPKVLAMLAKDGLVAGVVAKNPSASPETLGRLYRWREYDIEGAGYLEVAVLANPAAPLWATEEGARSGELVLATSVAKNPGAPVKLLRYLHLRGDPHLDKALAANPACPPALLDRISHKSSRELLRLIAANPSASAATLERLVRMPYLEVRNAVAANKNVSVAALEALLDTKGSDSAPRVVSTSPGVTKELQESLSRGNLSHREACAQVTTDVELLRLLSSDAHESVRQAVAERPIIDDDIAWALARDASTSVRVSLAENDGLSADVAGALLEDENEWVVQPARYNRNLRPGDRARALSNSDDPDDVFALAELLGSAEGAGLGVVVHPGWRHLEQVVAVALREETSDSEAVVWPEKPTSVLDLPGIDAMPWRIDRRIDMVEGREVTEGLKARVLRSKHALRVNANYMGNCTEGYSGRVASGESVILALVDKEGATRYNAELRMGSRRISVGEVNSRHNGGNVPTKVLASIGELAEAVSAGGM